MLLSNLDDDLAFCTSIFYVSHRFLDSNGKTRSTTGRMTPVSMRAAILRNCSPLALMKRNE